MTENKKKNRKSFALLLLGVVIGLVGGFILGMTIQQMICSSEQDYIAEAFNGEINVNFNETKFVEQSKDIIVPAASSILNNTVVRNFANCKPVPCDCWKDGCALYCMQCE